MPFNFTIVPNTIINDILSQLHFHIDNQTMKTYLQLFFYNYPFKQNSFPPTASTLRITKQAHLVISLCYIFSIQLMSSFYSKYQLHRMIYQLEHLIATNISNCQGLYFGPKLANMSDIKNMKISLS